ncbi:MAG TPA: hypothetical protein VGO26_08115 [Amnibacterium sp.]|jgi:hypothetical protein|nr:hypothetical protein [Amnibacterium sp.]
MRRVRLVYGGREFTIPGAESADIRDRIEAALAGGPPWLRAVSGQGRGTDAHLLITPGTPLVVLDETAEPDADPHGTPAGARPQPGPDTID